MKEKENIKNQKDMLVVQQPKSKSVSYPTAWFLVICWSILAILSTAFGIYAVVDGIKTISDAIQSDSTVLSFFKSLGIILEGIMFTVFIVLSIGKTVQYYLTIRLYNRTKPKKEKKTKVIDESKKEDKKDLNNNKNLDDKKDLDDKKEESKISPINK